MRNLLYDRIRDEHVLDVTALRDDPTLADIGFLESVHGLSILLRHFI